MHIYIYIDIHIRPTQSIMYVLFLVTRFHETILHIIQYNYLNHVQRIRCSKVWSFAQDYAVVLLVLNGWVVHWRKWFVPVLGTSSQTANRWGCPFNNFTWFVGSGRYIYVYWIYVYIYVYHIYADTHIYMYIVCIYIDTYIDRFMYT